MAEINDQFKDIDPAELTPEQAQQIIGSVVDLNEGKRQKYFSGDHWQDGEGWVGPLPQQESKVTSDYLSGVKRSFIFNNVCDEVINRHVNAVLAKEPQWGSALLRVLPEGEERTEVEDAQIETVDGLLTEWVDETGKGIYIGANSSLKTVSVLELMKEGARRMVASGRAYLRVLIPSNYLIDGVLEPLPMPDALARIKVGLCDNPSAAMYTRPDDMSILGLFVYKIGNETRAEITYLLPDDKTALVVNGLQIMFDLDGNLFHHEMNRDPLLTDSVLSQQKDLNRILTMGGRNMNLAGFPERTLLDGQLPGEYKKDENTGKEYFVPNEVSVGAGAFNVFQGITYTDEEGKTKHTSPSYQRLDPVGSAAFDEAVAAAKQRILNEVDQGHVLMNADATASGLSREQARHEFNQSLSTTTKAVEKTLMWLLSTVMRLAIATSTDGTGLMDGLKMAVQARVDTGPIDDAGRAEDRAAVSDGILSRETAMTRAGVDDVDAERARIESETKSSPAQIEQAAATAQVLISGGAATKESYIVAGFDDDTAEKLAADEFVRGGDTNNGSATEREQSGEDGNA